MEWCKGPKQNYFSSRDVTVLPGLLCMQTDAIDKRHWDHMTISVCFYILFVTAFRERNLARHKILNSHQNKWELKVFNSQGGCVCGNEIWAWSQRELYLSTHCNSPCSYRVSHGIHLTRVHSALQLPQCLLSPASGKKSNLFGKENTSSREFQGNMTV